MSSALRVHMAANPDSTPPVFIAKAVNIHEKYRGRLEVESSISPQDAVAKLWNGLLSVLDNPLEGAESITVNKTSSNYRRAEYEYTLPALSSFAWSQVVLHSDGDLSDYIKT